MNDVDESLFKELRAVEIEEGSLLFVNVGENTPHHLIERTREALTNGLEQMGYEDVSIFIMAGDISVKSIRPTEDREKWLDFLKESLEELDAEY